MNRHRLRRPPLSWMLGLFAFTPTLASAAEPTQVFIMAGQSNMTGYGREPEIDPALANQTDVLYDMWNHNARLPDGDYSLSVSTDWGPLEPKSLQPGGVAAFGPELMFGRTLADALDQPIAIIKASAQGSNILEHWERGLAPSEDYPEKSQLYHALFGSYDSATYDELLFADEVTRVDTAVGRFQADGTAFKFAAFVWVQGENEANWSASATYQQHLTTFISQVREDLATPDLPFVILKLSAHQVQSEGGLLPDSGVAAIRAAQTAVADADPNVALVDFDDVALEGPGSLHYTTSGYLLLGERLAETYLDRFAGTAGDGGGGQGGSGGDGGSGQGGQPAGGQSPSGGSPAEGGGGSGGGNGGGDEASGCDGCSVGQALPDSGVRHVLAGLFGALLIGGRARAKRRRVR